MDEEFHYFRFTGRICACDWAQHKPASQLCAVPLFQACIQCRAAEPQPSDSACFAQLPPDAAGEMLADLRAALEPAGLICFGGLPASATLGGVRLDAIAAALGTRLLAGQGDLLDASAAEVGVRFFLSLKNMSKPLGARERLHGRIRNCKTSSSGCLSRCCLSSGQPS